MTAATLAAQRRAVLALMGKLEPAVATAFYQAISAHSASINMPKLISLIETNQIEAAATMLKISPQRLAGLHEAIRSAFSTIGAAVVGELPKSVAASFSFDGFSPAAVSWIEAVGAELIQGISADSLVMARDVLMGGLTGNQGASDMARALVGRKVGAKRVGGFIGTTTQQAANVRRAADLLSDANLISDYFKPDGSPRYKESSRVFDGEIRRAIKAGRALPAGRVRVISEAHRQKSITARGKTIAKNEIFSAQSAAREEAYRQALENPNVEAVTVRWQHNLSQFPRPEHEAMNGTVIQFGETFDFSDAKMKRPHDPAGGARHSIGCRCTAFYRVIIKGDE